MGLLGGKCLRLLLSLAVFEMAFGHDGVHPPVLKHGPRSLTSVRVIYLLKVYGVLKGKRALCTCGVNRWSLTIGAAPAEVGQSV